VAKAELDADRAKTVEAESAVAAAMKSVTFREKARDRMTELFKSKAIDQSVLDEKEEQLEAAQESLAAAKAKVATSQTGRIQGEARLREAEASLRLAAAQQKAARRRVVVVVQVPERDALLLDRGDPAIIEFDGLPGRTFKGEVSRAAYGLDPKTRTMRTEIDLPNPDGRLRAGMYGKATIVLETYPITLAVPRSALIDPRALRDLRTAASNYCYRVVNGRAVKIAVKLGKSDGRDVEILEGLTAGETVVTGRTGGPFEDSQEVEIVDQLPIKDG
jgi:multidrug efflux pump subunit AcrA (membrane-fusion protein)